MKKNILLALVSITLCIVAMPCDTGKAEQIETTTQATTETTTKPRPKAKKATTETPETKYRYITGCPLDKELQRDIFDICERYNISFELVMAIIQQESNFDVAAVGDNGNSIGLMQIQPKWHSELADELGVSLYDPLGNVEVGAALLTRFLEEDNEVYYVLMKYNGGAAYANRMTEAGEVSDYALEVTERAYMYERENGI